jgi:hypothetical protein
MVQKDKRDRRPTPKFAQAGGGDGGGSEDEAPPDLGSGPSRAQREEKEKRLAAERYRKRHEAGETDEYKADMAKLAEVRKRREAASKNAADAAKAEEEVAAQVKALQLAQAEGEGAGGGGIEL